MKLSFLFFLESLLPSLPFFIPPPSLLPLLLRVLTLVSTGQGAGGLTDFPGVHVEVLSGI